VLSQLSAIDVTGPAKFHQPSLKIFDWIAVRAEGDHQLREPLVHPQAEGLELERVERLKWGIVERVVARKAAWTCPVSVDGFSLGC
jgi:hypothetical protein